jgi:hypothetical protein
MYLFEVLKQREHSKVFIITLYQAFYLKQLNLSMYYMSILLAKLDSGRKSFSETIFLNRVKRVLEKRFEQIYFGRQPFWRKEIHFYRSEQKEGLTTENYKTDPMEMGTNKFDIFGTMAIIEHFEKLVSQMINVVMITLVLEGYIGVDDQKPVIHLLPYAMYELIIENDKPKLAKLLKMHKDRTIVLSRSNYKKFRNGNLTKHFYFESMVCMSVSCMKVGLGRIIYVTKNCEGVFGVSPSNLEKKNISNLMSEELQSVHAELIYNFVRQHDKHYLGVEKKRFLKLRDNPLYTQTSAIVKLSPVVNDELAFVMLISNEESGEIYLMLNSSRKIIGYSKSLHYSFPQVDNLIGKKLSLLSTQMDTQYVSKIQSYLTKNYRMNRDSVAVELAKLNVLGSAKELFKQNLEDELKEQKEPVKISLAVGSLEKVVFNGNIDFEFTSVLLPPERGKGIFYEAILRMTIDQRNLSPLKNAFEREFASFSSKKPNKVTQTKIYDVLNKDKNKSYGMQLTRKLTPNQLKGSGLKQKQILDATTTIHYKDLAQSASLSQGQYIEYADIQMDAAGDKQSKDLESRPSRRTRMTDIENDSSSPESFTLKNKVQLVISKRSRAYFLKELVAILLVQLLVWSMGGYITILMLDSFYNKMSILIDLRRGLHIFTAINMHVWTSGIVSLEYILEKKGILDPNRYRSIISNYQRDLYKESFLEYERAATMSNKFQAHVYKFQWEYALRYLQNKASYTMPFNDNFPSNNFTRQYHFIDYYRTALFALRKWLNQVEKMDLNSPGLLYFMEVIGIGILEKIGTPTILLLMDSDSQTYSELTKSVSNIIIAAIIGSLLISNAIIAIILLINRKIIFVYSVFDKLYDFEISYQKLTLLELKTSLTVSISDGRQFHQEFHDKVSRKATPIVYLNYRKKSRPAKSGRVTRTLCGKCFGMVFFIVATFLLMESFNLTAYQVLNDVIDKSNNKLNTMVLSRSTISGNAGMHNVVYRIYVMSIYRSSLGIKNLNYNATIAAMRNSAMFFDTLFKMIDIEVSSNTKRNPGTLDMGLEYFNDVKPCEMTELGAYGMSMDECLALGDQSMTRSPVEVYRWLRYTTLNLMTDVLTLSSDKTIDILSHPKFLQLQLIRKAFTGPFILLLNTNIYDRLTEYNEQTKFLIQVVLMSYLCVSIFLASIFNCLGITHMRKQVKISLSSLLLLPSESLGRNPYIASVVNTLSKY